MAQKLFILHNQKVVVVTQVDQKRAIMFHEKLGKKILPQNIFLKKEKKNVILKKPNIVSLRVSSYNFFPSPFCWLSPFPPFISLCHSVNEKDDKKKKRHRQEKMLNN